MQIGEMNKIITLYTVGTTTLASGQKQETFTEGLTLFARYMPKGSEVYQANQKVALADDTFWVHNVITDLDKRMRLLYNGDTYEIKSIIPIEDDFFLEIMCGSRDNSNPIIT